MPDSSESEQASLLRLDVRGGLERLRAQPFVFWLLCLYFVVEYLRPQSVYPALDVVPWGDLTIGATLLALLFSSATRRPFYILDGLVLAFFTWVLLSVPGAYDPAVALADWAAIASWIVLYLAVTQILDTRERFFLFWLFFMLINFKMSQHGARTFMARGFSFADWGATGSPGWFQNSGEFAMQMAAFLGMSTCLLIALRQRLEEWKFWGLLLLLPGTALLSVAASSSRGGQLAALCVVVSLTLLSGVRLRTLLTLGAVILAGWVMIPQEQRERFEVMGEDNTSTLRLTYWSDAWSISKEHPLTGIGFRNWPDYSARFARNAQRQRVHSTPLQATVELGFPGALFFLAAVAATYWQNARTRRRARRWGDHWTAPIVGMAYGLDVGMVGLFIASLFMSVLFYPVFWTAFGLTVALAEASRRADVE